MSRIGRKPIVIPTGVEVKIDGSNITVKGPKGTLDSKIHPMMDPDYVVPFASYLRRYVESQHCLDSQHLYP